jgi:hypothetical protein
VPAERQRLALRGCESPSDFDHWMNDYIHTVRTRAVNYMDRS